MAPASALAPMCQGARQDCAAVETPNKCHPAGIVPNQEGGGKAPPAAWSLLVRVAQRGRVTRTNASPVVGRALDNEPATKAQRSTEQNLSTLRQRMQLGHCLVMGISCQNKLSILAAKANCSEHCPCPEPWGSRGEASAWKFNRLEEFRCSASLPCPCSCRPFPCSPCPCSPCFPCSPCSPCSP